MGQGAPNRRPQLVRAKNVFSPVISLLAGFERPCDDLSTFAPSSLDLGNCQMGLLSSFLNAMGF